jgi:spore maturation protein CgeB
MRCFEVMGFGAFLLSDAGKYPEGLDGDETMLTYETGENCLNQIEECLVTWSDAKRWLTKDETG